MKTRVLVFSAVVLALGLMGCSKSSTPAQPSKQPSGMPSQPGAITDTATKTFAVSESSSTAEIQIRQGQTFRVAIPANESTGYRWVVTGGTGDVVTATASTYEKTATPVLPGSGGVRMLTFRALKVGKTLVTLEYRPPGLSISPTKSGLGASDLLGGWRRLQDEAQLKTLSIEFTVDPCGNGQPVVVEPDGTIVC